MKITQTTKNKKAAFMKQDNLNTVWIADDVRNFCSFF